MERLHPVGSSGGVLSGCGLSTVCATVGGGDGGSDGGASGGGRQDAPPASYAASPTTY